MNIKILIKIIKILRKLIQYKELTKMILNNKANSKIL